MADRHWAPHFRLLAGGAALCIAAFASPSRAEFAIEPICFTTQSFPGVPQSLGLGDVNGDGRTDVVHTSRHDQTHPRVDGIVHLGRGHGSFAPPLSFQAMTGVLAIADVDRDGSADIVLADSVAHVFPGNGDGTFGLESASYSLGDGCVLLLARDLDGDGVADIAAATNSAIRVYLNDGYGTFHPGATLPLPAGSRPQAWGDANDDGSLDLFVSFDSGSGAQVVLGSPDGSFALGPTFAIASGSNVAMGVGDFNGDQRLDALALSPESSQEVVHVTLGHGDGTFDPAVTSTFAAGMRKPIGAADMDRDGRVDLVASIGYGPGIASLRGRGDGRFDFVGKFRPALPYGAPFELGDLNGDGVPDVVTVAWTEYGPFCCFYDSHIAAFLSNGECGFGRERAVPLASSPRQIAAADLDGDGLRDLIAVGNPGSAPKAVTILNNAGGGSFTTQFSSYYSVSSAVSTGDVDEDGRIDLVVALENRLVLLPGGENGIPEDSLGLGNTDWATRLMLVDLDQDGHLDLVASAQNGILVFLGHGDLSFELITTLPLAAPPWWFDAGDLDGDGVLDLAILEYGRGVVTRFRGRGDGRFDSQTGITLEYAPQSLKLADAVGDHGLDIIIAGNTRSMSTFENVAGDFPYRRDYPILRGAHSVDAADIDGDGSTEIVVAGVLGFLMSMDRGGEVVRSTGFSIDGAALGQVLLEDLDADGDLDIAGATYGSQSLALIPTRGWNTTDVPAPDQPRTGGASFALGSIAPNPSAGSVSIDYSVMKAAPVRIAVHDVQGREVARLADRPHTPGQYRARWSSGSFRPGLYLVTLWAPDLRIARKVVTTR